VLPVRQHRVAAGAVNRVNQASPGNHRVRFRAAILRGAVVVPLVPMDPAAAQAALEHSAAAA